MAKVGRPTKYTKELGNAICLRLSSESLRSICRDEEMPARKTVHLWLLEESKKEFLHQYNIACNTRAEELFDSLEEIADNTKGDVQRDRLRIDTKKWYLSKVMPKKYGDKLDMTSGGKALPTPILKLGSKETDE